MPESEREDPPERPETAPGPSLPPATPAIPPALELPTTFGKYFLTEKLATGGMAELYLAKIVGPGGFEKQLVIKQIHPKLSGQRHFVDLFVAEAKTLVTLAHGNIVPVYELGVIDDTYFIAMEYIDGPTLYRLTEALRRKGVTMEPAIAAWITARILDGLDYAHRKGEGVIHRDLSPRNVMLSRDGEVKLVDFGIAVTLGAGSGDEPGQSAPTGSFPYMSPEQVRKQPLTVQTDLFTVGVLLWEMLVGHRLFARSDPDATLDAVLACEIPRPSAENPDVPARLDEVVMRALERDQATRWATAADMIAPLQRYLYSLEDPPGPRDLAALVARYCPPETRRLPTHHDEVAEPTHPRAPATRAIGDRAPGRHASDDEPPRPGPRTAVIPRPGAAPRGRRPTRARTETFATHVALEKLLERGEPGGDRAAEPGPSTVAQRGDPTPVRPRPADPEDPAAGPSAASPPPGRVPSSASLLALAGLGAAGLALASVYVFYQGRGAALRPDAGPGRDARSHAIEPGLVDAGDAGPGDAPPAPPPPLDAAPTPDAREPAGASETSAPRRAPADAGPRLPRPDDHAPEGPGERTVRIDAGVARPTGTATLTVGANPWGNVLLDGKKIGRTPIERMSVPAGRHQVEVIFAGEDPPRSQRYTIELGDGEAKEVLADFTRP